MSEEPRESSGATLAVLILLMIVVGGFVGVMWAPFRDEPEEGKARFPTEPADKLVKQLAEGDRSGRRQAYIRLKNTKDREAAIPLLLAAAQDEDYGAREDAIELLGALDARDAIPWLVRLDDPDLAEARLVALERLQGEEALEAMREAMATGDYPKVQIALRALASWKKRLPDEVIEELLPFLRSDHWGLREKAAQAMGKQKHEAAVPDLVRLLDDPHGCVRKMSAWALVQIGRDDGVAAVKSALEAGQIPPDQ